MKMMMMAALSPLAFAGAMAFAQNNKVQQKPNVLLIVADDLGMGDLSCYGSKTISTPNIDALSADGIRFNNAYATSATSTPSRYAIFTGLYPWKNPDSRILPGDAPLLIPTNIPTLPKMMQSLGYATAAIGKWHLGMGAGNPDWNHHLDPDANTVGFDYTNLIAATNDRVPTVYIENGYVVGLDPKDPISVSYTQNFPGEPTALDHPELVKMPWHHKHNDSIVNGIPRIGFMKGGESAKWKDDQIADHFVGVVKKFISDHSKQPFFLYYGLHEPHVPRVPAARFVGKTTLGCRGDAVVEGDWCVGEVLHYLDSLGILDNTLVIFTSDNGPVVQDGYNDGSVEHLGSHDPSNGLRGGKYSLFDGGTHIPFIVYWKGHLHQAVSNAYFCQMDLFASLGHFYGAKVPSGLDSRNYANVLLGKDLKKGRPSQIIEAKDHLGLREGQYIMIPPYKGPKFHASGNEIGNLDDFALFDLSDDKGQKENLATKDPKRLEKMKKHFFDYVGTYYKPEVFQ